MSKQCPACGATVSDTAKFCRSCGTKIDAVKVVYCPECGARCTVEDRFCQECGFDRLEVTLPAGARVGRTPCRAP